MDNLDKAVFEATEEALHRIADMLYVINETLKENFFRRERKMSDVVGCEYCDGGMPLLQIGVPKAFSATPLRYEIIIDKDDDYALEDNPIVNNDPSNEWSYAIHCARIKYCPMCGRKLKEDD